LTVFVTVPTAPVTVLATVPVTAPSRPPLEEPGVEAAGVAWLVVEAWAFDPESSQNAAIRPRQQPARTRARAARRPAP
jgi:hypothetical protein